MVPIISGELGRAGSFCQFPTDAVRPGRVRQSWRIAAMVAVVWNYIREQFSDPEQGPESAA
jgi:hypothetical protein